MWYVKIIFPKTTIFVLKQIITFSKSILRIWSEDFFRGPIRGGRAPCNLIYLARRNPLFANPIRCFVGQLKNAINGRSDPSAANLWALFHGPFPCFVNGKCYVHTDAAINILLFIQLLQIWFIMYKHKFRLWHIVYELGPKN